MLFFFLLFLNSIQYLRQINLTFNHLNYSKARTSTLNLLLLGRCSLWQWTLWGRYCFLSISACLWSLTSCSSLICCISSKSTVIVAQIACFTNTAGVEPAILMLAQLRHLIATFWMIAILAHTRRIIVLLSVLTLRDLLAMLYLPLTKVISLPGVLSRSLHATRSRRILLLLFLNILSFFLSDLNLLIFLQFLKWFLLNIICICNWNCTLFFNS